MVEQAAPLSKSLEGGDSVTTNPQVHCGLDAAGGSKPCGQLQPPRVDFKEVRQRCSAQQAAQTNPGFIPHRGAPRIGLALLLRAAPRPEVLIHHIVSLLRLCAPGW